MKKRDKRPKVRPTKFMRDEVIYRITCLASGRIYIGKTKKPKMRWILHRSRLKTNSHHNKQMQVDYNEYGKPSFVFDFIASAKSTCLCQQEREIIKQYKELGFDMYNLYSLT